MRLQVQRIHAFPLGKLCQSVTNRRHSCTNSVQLYQESLRAPASARARGRKCGSRVRRKSSTLPPPWPSPRYEARTRLTSAPSASPGQASGCAKCHARSICTWCKLRARLRPPLLLLPRKAPTDTSASASGSRRSAQLFGGKRVLVLQLGSCPSPCAASLTWVGCFSVLWR